MLSLLPLIVWIYCLIAGGPAPSPGMPWSGPDLQAIEALSALDQRPVARFQSAPIYPLDLRKQGVTGSAVIGFIVDADGNVRDPIVLRATQAEFGAAALNAVSRWKFRPGFKAGHPVGTRLSVPITFSIGGPAPAAPDRPDAKRSFPPPDVP
jgi:protein TonB